jgi:hypothetical protein
VAITTKTSPIKAFDYKAACSAILRTLKRDRDRQVIARRFGFGLVRRQTLEQIGRNFGITRERVRQIEKSTMTKIASQKLAETIQANQLLVRYLQTQGNVAPLAAAAEALGTTAAQDSAYIVFLATLAPDIEVIDEDDEVRQSLAIAESFNARTLKQEITQIKAVIAEHNEPLTLNELAKLLSSKVTTDALASLVAISKGLAEFDGKWGLVSWPQVNPKSIRDKTYLVMNKHGKPMHFTQISEHIRNSSFRRNNVTVQAVHNELIKDNRFVLIGRGIYALAEWGYEPGTVADIIIDVLRSEAPLHKDEIIRRVLDKRQVRTTTIILNLQEKDHFVRVAKATYKLRDQDPA